MPPPLLSTRMIKSILHHTLCLGHSQRQCAQALGVSKGVVAKYTHAAAAAGLDWATIEPLDETALEHRLFPARFNAVAPVLPDFATLHRELSRKGVTLMLLWQEYQANYLGRRTLQYSQFCERYRQYAKTLKRSMRQVHRAGEKLFVDFAGPTLALTDGSRAHLFVSAMGASHYTYAQALPGQKTSDWIAGMAGALHFMGGVPQLIVPDNARAVIASPDRYEPRASDTVLDFANHYSCSILPARPYAPQDKASVESAVQVVERWILARLRHTRLSDLGAANRAIRPLLGELNERAFQKLPGSRASVFAQLDAPALSPLPTQRYEYARFKTVRVHVDYHVEFERHRYSVPHALVGVALDARITAHTVEMLHRGNRVAMHVRSHLAGGFTTVDAHMPAAHRAHRQWTPQRLIDWGLTIGIATGTLIEQLLQRYKHPEHGYRSALGLLSLAKRYGKARLEAACALALSLQSYYYRTVREILVNGRDRLAPSSSADWQSPEHEHLRGARSYH
ncbi:IS21 family transposase [Eoetvoesiella caeni]|uniref:Transposase n=1 Tax=Eoetvoesiella caeni TaxID=645616 RepID=A0A366H271_9BURK|nr:IS21 family transposase [Eoetvoesiella caeni]MCI2808323.1 IS21 family transposase [Eoetvoesiella caeni]NYT53674.1 IS21 family transposase [Eoetvoesiella caeni]RBP35992.1 transposase [Eoetvoesiella caeni]